MTLMRYLLEYTLETVCHGNRSECARRMGMEYTSILMLLGVKLKASYSAHFSIHFKMNIVFLKICRMF